MRVFFWKEPLTLSCCFPFRPHLGWYCRTVWVVVELPWLQNAPLMSLIVCPELQERGPRTNGWTPSERTVLPSVPRLTCPELSITCPLRFFPQLFWAVPFKLLCWGTGLLSGHTTPVASRSLLGCLAGHLWMNIYQDLCGVGMSSVFPLTEFEAFSSEAI